MHLKSLSGVLGRLARQVSPSVKVWVLVSSGLGEYEAITKFWLRLMELARPISDDRLLAGNKHLTHSNNQIGSSAKQAIATLTIMHCIHPSFSASKIPPLTEAKLSRRIDMPLEAAFAGPCWTAAQLQYLCNTEMPCAQRWPLGRVACWYCCWG